MTQGPDRSRESRATIALVSVGLFAIFIWLTVATSGQVPLERVPVLLLGLATPALSLLAGYGLDRRQPWALAAMGPLLALMIVGSVLETAIALAGSRINIPLGLILAVWSLSGSPERPSYAADVRAGPLVLAYAMALALPLLL